MAKRGRIPNRKAQGGAGMRHRNKNPKLSPFQREQKRTRLSNQPPIDLSKRDFPSAARGVVYYLNAKKEREDEKKQQRKLAMEAARLEAEAEAAPKAEVKRSRKRAREDDDAAATAAAPAPSIIQKKKTAVAEGVSDLNAELINSLDVGDVVKSHNDAVLRRKEKSARKKMERRKQNAREKHAAIEYELKAALRKEEGGGDDEDEFGGYHDENQVDENGEPIAKRQRKEGRPQPQQTKAQRRRERLKLKKELAAEEGITSKKEKRKEALELDEKIDVIRYGERVDAPPVFDVVPRANADSLLPTHRVGHAKKLELSERKRLQKLGLLPATSAPLGLDEDAGPPRMSSTGHAPLMMPAGSSGGVKRPTTSDEFEAYRQQVIESYNKHRKTSALFTPQRILAGKK